MWRESTDGFPHKGSAIRSFCAFFVVTLKKLWNKQPNCQDLRRHDAYVTSQWNASKRVFCGVTDSSASYECLPWAKVLMGEFRGVLRELTYSLASCGVSSMGYNVLMHELWGVFREFTDCPMLYICHCRNAVLCHETVIYPESTLWFELEREEGMISWFTFEIALPLIRAWLSLDSVRKASRLLGTKLLCYSLWSIKPQQNDEIMFYRNSLDINCFHAIKYFRTCSQCSCHHLGKGTDRLNYRYWSYLSIRKAKNKAILRLTTHQGTCGLRTIIAR